jgi:DNA-binding MarR family transcriptional regulator
MAPTNATAFSDNLLRSKHFPKSVTAGGEHVKHCRAEKKPKERFLTTRLGFDRTVVHRSIKAMVEEGLASETKAKTGRALLVKLTAKGNKYRENLVREWRAAEEKLRKELTDEQTATLIRLLKVMAELEI